MSWRRNAMKADLYQFPIVTGSPEAARAKVAWAKAQATLRSPLFALRTQLRNQAKPFQVPRPTFNAQCSASGALGCDWKCVRSFKEMIEERGVSRSGDRNVAAPWPHFQFRPARCAAWSWRPSLTRTRRRARRACRRGCSGARRGRCRCLCRCSARARFRRGRFSFRRSLAR